MANIKVGIIGGTGLDHPKYLGKVKKIQADTFFGKPGSPIYSGYLEGLEVFHLARHGEEHTIPSTRVNYRANMLALKELGCSYIISTSTCGSLQEEICPGEFIVLDQFIDLTRQRATSIYDGSEAGEHRYTSMARPFSEELRDHLVEGAIVNGFTVHTKGTVITIEGPRFSTRAESNLYRSWKADVINMTTAPEAIIANELDIPFATIALCASYDSWRTETSSPTPPDIMEIINGNTGKLMVIITHALLKISQGESQQDN